MAYFPSDKYTFDCKYVSFCIELNTFIRLKIANFFLFLIFSVCYLYVMSQSTFHDQIRPRPLIACLNFQSLRLKPGFQYFSTLVYFGFLSKHTEMHTRTAPVKLPARHCLQSGQLSSALVKTLECTLFHNEYKIHASDINAQRNYVIPFFTTRTYLKVLYSTEFCAFNKIYSVLLLNSCYSSVTLFSNTKLPG